MADDTMRRIKQALADAEALRRDMEAQRAAREAPSTAREAEAFRDRFTEEWEQTLERLEEEANAPSVVPRTGHPGDPPEYAQDPKYVPPDELPEGNVSPEYDTLTGFLYGKEWLYVTSSWVKAIQFNDEEQYLVIEFLEGAVCQYPGVTENMAMEFATAPSKGRWIHQNLIPWDYVLLSVGATGGKPEAASPRYAKGPRRINRFSPKRFSIPKRSYKPRA